MKMWTKEEMELLANNIDMPKSELEKLFPDRSWISVKRRKVRLKKGIPYSEVERKMWSKEEEKLLAKNMHKPKSELGKLFPSRSWHSIKRKKEKIKGGKKVEARPVRKIEETRKHRIDPTAVEAYERFMDYNRMYWQKRVQTAGVNSRDF